MIELCPYLAPSPAGRCKSERKVAYTKITLRIGMIADPSFEALQTSFHEGQGHGQTMQPA